MKRGFDKRPLRWTAAILVVTLLAYLAFEYGPRAFRAAQWAERWLFPVERSLFVLDERPGANFAADLEWLFPECAQRDAGIRIVVRRIDPAQVISGLDEWRTKPGSDTIATEDSLLFVRLGADAGSEKKLLRLAVENSQSGHSRREVLRRVIAIVPTPEGDATRACAQLSDDWVYAQDNFGGLALAVDDRTQAQLGGCLRKLLTHLHPHVDLPRPPS